MRLTSPHSRTGLFQPKRCLRQGGTFPSLEKRGEGRFIGNEITVTKGLRGFTLLELLVVLFIIMTLAFLSFPSIWGELVKDDNVALASALRNIRREAISAKKEIFFTVDFKERLFRVSGTKGEAKEKPRIIDMNEGETWEVFIPSKGTIKEGQVIIAFSPSVQEELIALYLSKNGKEISIILNNLSGEVEIEEGKRKFDE